MSEHPSLTVKKLSTVEETARLLEQEQVTAESVEIVNSLLEQVKPLVEIKRRLRETDEDLKLMLKELLVRLEQSESLKRENLEKEREVLDDVKRRLGY